MTRRRWLVLGGLVIAGLLAVYLGWRVGGTYLPGLLADVGVGLVLFGSLFMLERSLEQRIEEQGESIAHVAERVTEVEAKSSDLAARLTDLGALTKNAIQAEEERATRALTTFDEEVTAGSTRHLLQEGNRIRAIDPRGVRVIIDDTSLHARFRVVELEDPVGESTPAVMVTIEDTAGYEIESLIWQDQPACEFLADLATKLKSVGAYVRSFDGGKVLERLRDTIRTGVSARSGMGGPNDLGPLIEVPNNQWAVTTYGVEGLEFRYTIEFGRVSESDWVRHMKEKTWVNIDHFQEALFIAQAIHSKMESDKANEMPF